MAAAFDQLRPRDTQGRAMPDTGSERSEFHSSAGLICRTCSLDSRGRHGSDEEASCPEELCCDVIKREAAVVNIRGAKPQDGGSRYCGISSPCSANEPV